MRRCDEIQAAEVVKSPAELAAEAKAEREKKIRESTIDSVTGGIAMNLYRLLSDEQVRCIPYIFTHRHTHVIHTHRHLHTYPPPTHTHTHMHIHTCTLPAHQMNRHTNIAGLDIYQYLPTHMCACIQFY